MIQPPCPFDQALLDELPYDPEVLLLDQIESIDPESRRVVCRMPTDSDLPFTRSQRVHPVRHPAHVSGAVMVHVTAMLGFVHAYLFHALRASDGWTGYGTHIHHAVFRKLVPPGLPMLCSCTERKVRRMPDRIFCTYAFEFTHEGQVAYESEQSAMWLHMGAELEL